MERKISALMLSILVLLSSTVVTINFSAVTVSADASDFTYRLINGDTEVEITGYAGPGGAVTIPSTIDGKPVTSIGSYAFQYCSSLTSVTTGNNVTTIGYEAFYNCDSLTSVIISASVTSIGSWAFEDCDSLTTAIFNGNAPSTGYGWAYGCDQLTVFYYEGATGFGTPTWNGIPCYPLGSTPTPPNGLTAAPGNGKVTLSWSAPTYVGDSDIEYYFIYQDGEYVTQVPGTVTSAIITGLTNGKSYEFKVSARNSFGHGPNATVTAMPPLISDGLVCRLINNDAEVEIIDYEGPGSAVTIPSTIDGKPVTSISDWAFGYKSLTSVTIPDSVTYIGGSAFYNCYQLISATIGNNVTSIGSYAFQYCSSLTSIEVDSDNPAYSSLDGVLYNKDVTTLIQFPGGKSGEFVIPASVIAIGSYAFYQCTALTSVTIGSGVTSIGVYAFTYCSKLTSVTIPDSVTVIGERAFSDCGSLTAIRIDSGNPGYSSLDGVLYNKAGTTLIQFPAGKGGEFIIPDSVTTIGSYAFHGCSLLTTIKIPETIITIVSFDFTSCTALATMMFQGNAPSLVGGYSYASGDLVMLVIYYYEGATGFDTSPWTGMSCYPLGSTPTAPNGLTATPGNGNVTISWSPPTYVGDSSIDHYVIYVDGTKYGEFTATSAVVTGLTNGQSYTFKVAAHNSFGNGYNVTATAVPNMISNGLLYQLINSGTEVEITGYIGPGGAVTIPGTIDGRPVTSVSNYAFSWDSTLTSITIPDSVTNIGDDAFSGCSKLTSISVDPHNPAYSSLDGVLYNKDRTTLVQYPGGKSGGFTIPDSVTAIDSYAFRYCSKLTSVTIGNNVTTIGNYAFASCSLTVIEIPDSVTTIGWSAFQYCSVLTSVTIGRGITYISSSMFSGCSALTDITVVPDNPNYASLDGVLYSKDLQTLILCPKGKSGSFTIPDSVTLIGGSAFEGCTALTFVIIGNNVTTIDYLAFNECSALTTIEIPDSVTFIGWYAFQHCFKLTSVSIPDSVTDIGDGAFYGCIALTAINVDPDNPNYVSVDGVLYSKDFKILIQCPGAKVGSLMIPDSVTHINNGAFYHCTALTSVTIGNNVVSIGNEAFYYCTALTAITIPDSVTSIGSYAFQYCAALTATTFNGDAPSLGYDWAYGCDQLTVYYYEGATGFTTPTWNGRPCIQWDTLVPGSPSNLVATPGKGQVTLSWSEPSFTGSSSIDYYVVYRDGALVAQVTGTSITITGLTNDRSYVFKVAAHNSFGNGRNATVTAVPTLVSDGFIYRLINGDSEVEITGYIGPGGAVTIPNDIDGRPVTRIGSEAFEYCSALTSVTIPASVAYIGSYAFAGCSALTSVTIPASVTSIGDGAFIGCDSLTFINVDSGNPSYSSLDGVLYNKAVTMLIQCPGGKSGEFAIPASVTSIGLGAFAYCTNLTSVTIPDGVTSIGSYAFEGCSFLTSVTIPASVISIGSDAFSWCAALTTMVFNGDAPSTGYDLAYESDQLTIYYYDGKTGFTTPTWNGIPCYILGSTPTAPNELTAVPGNGNMTLSWSEPSFTGSSSIDYYVVYRDGALVAQVTGTSITITGLTNDRSYVFKVAAHNSFGNGRNATVTAVPTLVSDGFIYRLINGDSEVEITGYIGPGGAVTIPGIIDGKPVTSIGSEAFWNRYLTSVSIPDSVTSIGSYAFEGCSFLTSVTLGNNVTSIGSYAFNGCSALTSVTIPNSVTSIGSYAFQYCAALTAMVFNGDAPLTGYDWIYGCDKLTISYYEGATGFTTPYWQGRPCYPLMKTPDAPRDLTVMPGDSQVSLSWSEPGFTGSSNIDYYIVYRDGVDIRHVTGTSATITGLVNGQSYVFNVSAHNSFGNGRNATVTATPWTLAIISPAHGSCSPDGDVTVEWSLDGSPDALDHFVVTVGGKSYVAAAGASSYGPIALSDGAYAVKVAAVNKDGGIIGATEASFTVEAAAPTITGHTPTGTDVAVGSAITVTFSEAMNKSSVSIVIDGGEAIAPSSWDGNTAMFSLPTLKYNTQYAVAVSGKDAAGNSLTGTTSWSFATLKNEGSISGVIKDKDGHPVADATVSLSNGRTATTDHNGRFAFADVASGTYTLTIAKDGYGTLSRSVTVVAGGTADQGTMNLQTSDVTAPTVTKHSPAGDDESTVATITVTFSEAMNKTSVSIVVSGVAGTVSWNGNNATFTPSAALKGNIEYEVVVNGKDLAGNEMEEEFSWGFTTADVGTVSGVIKDKGGNPIADAKVTLKSTSTSSRMEIAPLFSVQSTLGETLVTYTDSEGRYAFYDVSKGTYTLTIEKDGHETVTQNVKVTSKTVESGTVTVNKVLSKDGGSGDSILIIVGVVAAIVIAALVAVMFMRRKT